MSRAARVVVGIALVVAGVVAMGLLTRFGWATDAERAELRLAWRTSVPRVVECREPTAEELAELPIHMRQDEICEGRAVAYRLEVRVDGELRHAARVEAAGARGDRPLYVFEELPLEPGMREVSVVFEREDFDFDFEFEFEEGEGEGEGEGASRGTGVPDRVVWEREMRVEDREVVLIGYDPDRRVLVRRTSPGGR